MNKRNTQLIVALDVDTLTEAKSLVKTLSPVADIYKVGSQLFTACGPHVVQYILDHGKQIFLDLKFHDIPNTVANAVSAATALRGKSKKSILMYSLHTQGGEDMLKAAVQAGIKVSQDLKVTRPLAVGITVLTSDGKKDNIRALVLERVRLAKECGLDGVVASVEETALIRQECGKDFIIVTPGIRPKGSEAGDQQRVATPADAIRNGSDYLVVGRPIVKASQPLIAARKILEEMGLIKS